MTTMTAATNGRHHHPVPVPGGGVARRWLRWRLPGPTLFVLLLVVAGFPSVLRAQTPPSSAPSSSPKAPSSVLTLAPTPMPVPTSPSLVATPVVIPAAPVATAPPATGNNNAGGGGFGVNIGIGTGAGANGPNGGQPADVSTAVQVLVFMTLLTLAPSIVMLMTSFTRIVIVLSFVRTALGVQSAPSNQILVGLSLFLTLFLMAPVWTRVNAEAVQPYQAKLITSAEALDRAAVPVKRFMLKQTRPSEVEFFLGLSGQGPTAVEALPMRVVVPAFVVSELRTAFQMGFLIFIPFLVIDFLVASTLMSMGMMMMPPTTISLPFKLLLFVLVDGWHLVIRSLVQSFG